MAFVEDHSEFMADYGVDATLVLTTVRGIFDSAAVDAFGIVSGTHPVFLCVTADVPSVAEGQSIVVNSVAYTVANIEHDGSGMTRLILEAA